MLNVKSSDDIYTYEHFHEIQMINGTQFTLSTPLIKNVHPMVSLMVYLSTVQKQRAMNTSSKAFFYLLLIVHKIILAEEGIREITAVIEDVRKLYLSPSVFIVYNKRHYGFEKERIPMETIMTKSRQYSVSQAISYEKLINSPTHRENVLYALLIHDTKDLQLAINATKNIDMSLHPWLLLSMKNSDFDCDNPGDNFFKLRMNTKMTAKCYGDVILKKYYAIFDNRTEVINVAKWMLGKISMLEARTSLNLVTNMTGVTLNLAKHRDANDELNENSPKFVRHVIKELENYGNFNGKVSQHEDRMGHFDRKTNSWSGLMKILIEKEADIGMVFFSLSNSRWNVVDFATPLAKARFYLYGKLPDTQKIRWNAYFKVFNVYTWMAIGLSILAFSILLCLMNLQTLTISSFFQQLINVWGIFSQQGLPENPTNTASRILSFSILFLALIIQAIYSASITSYITQLTADLPFSNYDEFLQDNNYKITVLKESRDEDLFFDDDKQLSSLQSRLKKHCFRAENAYEGFNQACEPKTVFYSDEVSFDGIESPPCKLGSVDIKRTEHMSFILTKNSPYTRTISHFLHRFREHGIIQRLKNKYFFKFTEIPGMQPNVISFEEILPILSIWIAGVIVAVLIWFLEVVVYSFGRPIRL